MFKNKKEIKILVKKIDEYVKSYNNTKNLNLKSQLSTVIYQMEMRILQLTLSK